MWAELDKGRKIYNLNRKKLLRIAQSFVTITLHWNLIVRLGWGYLYLRGGFAAAAKPESDGWTKIRGKRPKNMKGR